MSNFRNPENPSLTDSPRSAIRLRAPLVGGLLLLVLSACSDGGARTNRPESIRAMLEERQVLVGDRPPLEDPSRLERYLQACSSLAAIASKPGSGLSPAEQDRIQRATASCHLDASDSIRAVDEIAKGR